MAAGVRGLSPCAANAPVSSHTFCTDHVTAHTRFCLSARIFAFCAYHRITAPLPYRLACVTAYLMRYAAPSTAGVATSTAPSRHISIASLASWAHIYNGSVDRTADVVTGATASKRGLNDVVSW